uniref:Platelet endothelial cell adhesion molecule n=1 Tax=Pavo cristatus TaxID=9049 RepID=A0A8C9LGP2_PAVCR
MYLALLVIFLHCTEICTQERVFTFNAVHIKVQPSVKVKNGAPMSIICHADISKSTNFNLQHNITIFKDGKLVFMSVSGREDARYEVPVARSSHTGDYQCAVEADGKIRHSDPLHVWVTGMTKPTLIAEKKDVFEGEMVKLRCEMPEEVPPLYFIFRKIKMNSTPKEELKHELHRNFSVIQFPIDEGDNILQFDCFGRRSVKFEFETSEPSNRTLITVKEPFIKPTLRIKPSNNITEGKEIQFECSTVVAKMRNIEIILLRNKTILSSVRDQATLKYSAVATLEDSGEYTCKVEKGKASKTTTRHVVVTELFPKPILNASMNKLDENKELTLSCSIKDFQNASFSILRRNSNGDTLLRNSRNLTMRANVNDTGSYICKAEVNRIVKESKPVMIRVYGELIQRLEPSARGRKSLINLLISGAAISVSCNACDVTLLPDIFLWSSNDPYRRGVGFGRDLWRSDLMQCNWQYFFSFLPVLAPVSMPRISAFSGLPEVVLGRPLNLTCCLMMGTPPITFTFYKENKAKKEIVTNNTCAVFLDEDIKQNDKGQYKCGAKNHHSSGMKTSKILNITVIGKSVQFFLTNAIFGFFEAAYHRLSKMVAKFEGHAPCSPIKSPITASNRF